MNKGRSIKFKITFTVLSMSILALLVLGAATIINIGMVRNDIVSANAELGAAAAADSAAALEQETVDKLESISTYLSQVADEKLGKIKTYTEMLADCATQIFSDPEAWPLRHIDPPLAENTDKLAVYYTKPASVPAESVYADAQLAANARDLMYEIPNFNPSIASCYISFNSGLHVVADASSGSRLAADYDYDPRTRPFFANAEQNRSVSFTDVTDDARGRGLGIICSAPFYNAEGEMLGAVGVGALIADITEIVLSSTIGESGETFVLNGQAQMIIGADVTKDAEGKIIRKDFTENADLSIRQIAQEMKAGLSDVKRVNYEGREVYMGYHPIASTGWILVTLVDVDEALALASATAEKIDAVAGQAADAVDKSIITIIVTILVILALISALVLLVGMRQAKKLTDPLGTLAEGVKVISEGNLDYKLALHTGDELENLADAFNYMTEELQDYISNLASVTADKERIATELNVASTIQSSMLPGIFPAFPERNEFDVYATMLPAKEVGGDFYDFFLIDNTHLGIVMADVSGKGVPAALFMVIAKTLIKNHAQLGKDAARTFTAVNEQLCEGNEAGMFVTGWLGILDIASGHMIYANAGHNPPLLQRSNGQYEYLSCRPGFVLAGMEGVNYRQAELDLAPGDRLYLYTDGVTEATSAAEELFGEERLRDTLNSSDGMELPQVLQLIQNDINEFVGQAPQFDDITMLLLEYRGATAAPQELTVAADTEQWPAVLDFINARLDAADCPPAIRNQIDIAAEELFVNIAHYAYGEASGQVTVGLTVEEGPPRSIRLQFRDNGAPYDPLAKPDPDITLSAEQRQIGGLGIYMVKKTMDAVDYQYRDGQNVLTIIKNLL